MELASLIWNSCLCDMEFRDALHLRYCRTPTNLPTHCDGCGAKFSIVHGLECKERRTSHPTPCQNQVWASRPCRIPSVVRDEPQIYPGRSADVDETEGMSTRAEERGDLLMMNIWKHQTDCIGITHHSSETGNSPSFPWARKEVEIPPSLPGPTPSLHSLCGLLW